MKTKEQIQYKINNLEIKLNDALEENIGGWDANDLQVALDELKWVIM